MRLRWIVPALFMALMGSTAIPGQAQETPEKPAAPQIQEQAPPFEPAPQVKESARAFIEEGLKASHAAEIFADLRRTLREVNIPAVRDLAQGAAPGIAAPDAETAAELAKLLTFLDYASKAGDELDAALSENREAMISDAAGQIAKTAKLDEIEDIRAILKLPAIRKAFDATYSMSKLLTGFSYEETQTFSAFSAWADAQNFNWERAFPETAPDMRTVPSKHKIAKAQALVTDMVEISHADEIAADLSRFLREVYAESAPLSAEEKQELLDETAQFEFMYNMQKAVVLAAAPSAVASALTDEQIAVTHKFVRSDAFAKLFNLLRDSVKTGTAFTKEDIAGAEAAFKDLEKKTAEDVLAAAERKRVKAEWDALADKWTELLKNRVSTDTRLGLERSLQDLIGSPDSYLGIRRD